MTVYRYKLFSNREFDPIYIYVVVGIRIRQNFKKLSYTYKYHIISLNRIGYKCEGRHTHSNYVEPVSSLKLILILWAGRYLKSDTIPNNFFNF